MKFGLEARVAVPQAVEQLKLGPKVAAPKVELASVIDVTCARLALGGKGVCFQPGSPFVVLVNRALPGEQLQARVTKLHKGYAEAVKLTTLVPHHHAVKPPCIHFGPCGGCTLQSLDYQEQLVQKQNQVLQTLTRVGKLSGMDEVMQLILGCGVQQQQQEPQQHQNQQEQQQPLEQRHQQAEGSGETVLNSSHQEGHPGHVQQQYNIQQPDNVQQQLHEDPHQPVQHHGSAAQQQYRNKLLFTFSSWRWEPGTPADHTSIDAGLELESPGRVVLQPTLGFLRPGSQDHVLPVTTCLLGSPMFSTIMHCVSRATKAEGLLPANDPSGQGCLVNMVVRRAARAWYPETVQQDLGATEVTHNDGFIARQLPRLEQLQQQVETSQHPGQAQAGQDGQVANRAAVGCMAGDSRRVGDEEGRFLVTLATRPGVPVDALRRVASRLMAEVPQVAGVVHKVVPEGLPRQQPATISGQQSAIRGEQPATNGGQQPATTSGQQPADPPATAGSQKTSTVPTAAAGQQRKGSSRGDSRSGPLASAGRKVVVNAGSGRARLNATAGSGGLDASSDNGNDDGSWSGGTGGTDGTRSRLLLGTEYLLERLCGLWFRVAADSFFQTNSAQAEVLYAAVGRAAALRPSDTLLDLYCGTGSIGLTLASQCKHVLGYEAIEAAVVDARFNAKLNGITNASFICGDLEGGLAQPTHQQQPATYKVAGKPTWRPSDTSNAAAGVWRQPDVVVVNPARAGLSAAVIAYLKQCGARRVVYVSCNPATQARDLALLCNPAPALAIATTAKRPSKPTAKPPAAAARTAPAGRGCFRLVSFQPVDMFPHTDHVENVAVLDREPS